MGVSPVAEAVAEAEAHGSSDTSSAKVKICQCDIFLSLPCNLAYNTAMYSTQNKERLYVCDLLDNPAVAYPSYYTLSTSLCKNEMLKTALIALHSFDFSYYETAKSHEDIFAMFHAGTFAIYKEKYIVGYFGGKMMYLESNGWKSMPSTEDIFMMENWLVC